MKQPELRVTTDLSDPFHSLITAFVVRQFPQHMVKNQAQLLDMVSDAIFSTGQNRYGPKPAVEAQAAMREVMAHYIERKLPIPFMVPWGSEKPDGTGIDVAELSALKTLHCLNSRVSELYAPGTRFNIRMEDASAPHLFFENQEKARLDAKRYVGGLKQLIEVLDFNWIAAVPESSLVTEEQFNTEADATLPLFEDYLRLRILQGFERDDVRSRMLCEKLKARGWLGTINNEMLEYYVSVYEKLYSEKTKEQKIHILARYFAGALARRSLRIRGDDPSWGGKFLELSFVPPVPGTEAVFNRRVTYRTVPSCLTTNHIPPWRAKGYLLLNNDNTATPKLASFNERREYNQQSVVIARGDLKASVQMDYIVEE